MNILFDVISTATGLPTANDQRPVHPAPAKTRRAGPARRFARNLLTDISGAAPLRAFEGLRRWDKRRKAVAELHALDDRLLEDIGINRRSIRELVDAQLQAEAEAETADPRRAPASPAPASFNLGARPCVQPC